MVNEGIIIADGLIKIKVLEINTSGRRPRVRKILTSIVKKYKSLTMKNHEPEFWVAFMVAIALLAIALILVNVL
jgi:hypothetical protein